MYHVVLQSRRQELLAQSVTRLDQLFAMKTKRAALRAQPRQSR